MPLLEKIFEGYLKIQESGFVWDLHYNKRLYRDVEFVLFTPFFKLDSDEAEQLCGKYTSRNFNVAQNFAAIVSVQQMNRTNHLPTID